MRTPRVLSLLAAVLLAMAGLGYGLHVANAGDNGRAIPTLEATSPSAGTIVVTWENPSETGTLASYRVSWGLWENGLTSYRDANSETGGNAYPTAPASSHTITGLAPGEYIVAVRARYEDNRNGAFKESGKVMVASANARTHAPAHAGAHTRTHARTHAGGDARTHARTHAGGDARTHAEG